MRLSWTALGFFALTGLAISGGILVLTLKSDTDQIGNRYTIVAITLLACAAVAFTSLSILSSVNGRVADKAVRGRPGAYAVAGLSSSGLKKSLRTLGVDPRAVPFSFAALVDFEGFSLVGSGARSPFIYVPWTDIGQIDVAETQTNGVTHPVVRLQVTLLGRTGDLEFNVTPNSVLRYAKRAIVEDVVAEFERHRNPGTATPISMSGVS